MPLPIIAPFLISSAIQWVAQHHDEILPIASRASDFMSDVLTNGGIANTVKQVGNTIIWNRPDGASHVIGMLDQLDTHIDNIDTVQKGIVAGLSGLKSISMVTLGFSGISVALVAAQSVVLTRRLDQISKQIANIGQKIDEQIEAEMSAALSLMRSAEAQTGEKREHNYNAARQKALTAGAYFRKHALNPAMHEDKLSVMRFYAGKYFSGLSMELGSLLGLEETKDLNDRLNVELPYLKAVASQMYERTLVEDVEWYLSPELRDVASLESISSLFEQAKEFDCVPRNAKMSPADVFEANRRTIFSSGSLHRAVSPKFHAFRKAAAQKLQTVQATFEEVTRLLSWREAVAYLTQNGSSPMEVAGELRKFRESQQTPTNSSPFIAYAVSPSNL